MAVIGITYDGCDHYFDENGKLIQLDPSTLKYHHVYIYTDKGEYKFESGNFVKDWFDAKKRYLDDLSIEEPLSQSSSCDHFIIDGGKFDSAYLHIVNNKGVLKYVDTSDPNYLFTQMDVYEKGWEYFVPTGTQPSWEELKEMCK